jgi:hypothetical protein
MKEQQVAPETLIPLSHLALDLDTTTTDLAAQLADQVLTDDLGRLAIDRSTARDMIALHQAQQRALADRQAEEAARHAVEQQRAQRQQAAEAKAREAREARQRQLRQDNPGLTALELMMLDDSDPSGRRSAAGRRFDELINAQNRGDAGTFHRISPQQQEGTP